MQRVIIVLVTFDEDKREADGQLGKVGLDLEEDVTLRTDGLTGSVIKVRLVEMKFRDEASTVNMHSQLAGRSRGGTLMGEEMEVEK